MKIRPVGAECSMWTKTGTDMTNQMVIFRNFAKAPKKIKKCCRGGGISHAWGENTSFLLGESEENRRK
jgi:hypothetical protein